MLVFLAGCTTAHEARRVTPGMTRAEVLEIMGPPKEIQTVEGVEYLEYHVWRGYGVGSEWAETPRHERIFWDPEEIIFIRLKDGRVDAYGKEFAP